MMALDIDLPLLQVTLAEVLDLLYSRGWIVVVDVRVVIGEALDSKQLHRVQRSIWLTKLRMPFGRNLTQAMIRWHYCPPGRCDHSHPPRCKRARQWCCVESRYPQFQVRLSLQAETRDALRYQSLVNNLCQQCQSR